MLLKRTDKGDFQPVTGDLNEIGGRTKVQVVGHGGQDGEGRPTLGGVDAKTLAQDIKSNLESAPKAEKNPAEIAKVALVGCETGACGKPNLAAETGQALRDLGVKAPVKGYEQPIKVTADGRKQATTIGDPEALPNPSAGQHGNSPASSVHSGSSGSDDAESGGSHSASAGSSLSWDSGDFGMPLGNSLNLPDLSTLHLGAHGADYYHTHSSSQSSDNEHFGGSEHGSWDDEMHFGNNPALLDLSSSYLPPPMWTKSLAVRPKERYMRMKKGRNG